MGRSSKTSLIAVRRAVGTPAPAGEPVQLADHQSDHMTAGFSARDLLGRLVGLIEARTQPRSGDKSGRGPLGVSTLDLGSRRLLDLIAGVSGMDLGSGR